MGNAAVTTIYGPVSFLRCLREHWILFFLITSLVMLGAVLLPRPVLHPWRAWATVKFPATSEGLLPPRGSGDPRPSALFAPGLGELLSSDAAWSRLIDQQKWQREWGSPTPRHALNELRRRLTVIPGTGESIWRVAVRESNPVQAAERSNQVAAFLVNASKETDAQQKASLLAQKGRERVAQLDVLEETYAAVTTAATEGRDSALLQREAMHQLQTLRWTEAQIASLPSTDVGAGAARVISVAQANQAEQSPLNAIILGVALLSAWSLGALLALILSRGRLPRRLLQEVTQGAALPIVRWARWNGRNHFVPREAAAADRLAPSYADLLAELARLPAGDCLALALVPEGGGEAFSEVVVRLADAFAETGQTVLLIDAEMRRPSLHDYFGAGPQPGLSDYLSGEMRMGETILKTRRDSLWLVPSGPRPEDPSLLLTGKRFDDLLWQMRSRFDVILLACPGLQEYSETRTIIERVDHVIAVTPLRQLSRPRLAAFAKAVSDNQGTLSGLLVSCPESLRSVRQAGRSGSEALTSDAR